MKKTFLGRVKLMLAPLPDLLLSNDGITVESAGEWEEHRRDEVLELFRSQVYGRVPQTDYDISFQVQYQNNRALGVKAVPLFVGLNFYGNHTIHPCTEISITDSWVANKPEFGITENRATEPSRDVWVNRWPLEMILARGYGLATIYYGDIDPDFHDGFANGIEGLLQENGKGSRSDAWGSIAPWSRGLSRVMDYFETDPALSRRPFGERLSKINEVFPYWFAEKFHEYGDSEAACPVDQHMLLALMAPRPIYVASAKEDEWGDPVGEYLSLVSAGEVYRLYGKDVLMDEHSPELNQPRWVGKQGDYIRTGKHDVTGYDWEQFLTFADLHMGKKSNSQVVNLSSELESSIRGKLMSGDQFVKQGLQLLEKNAGAMLEL